MHVSYSFSPTLSLSLAFEPLIRSAPCALSPAAEQMVPMGSKQQAPFNPNAFLDQHLLDPKVQSRGLLAGDRAFGVF